MANFIDAERVEVLRDCFSRGIGTRPAAALAGTSKITAILYFKQFRLESGIARCECGQDARHQGWCSWRFQRSESRQAVMAAMPRREAADVNGLRPGAHYLGFGFWWSHSDFTVVSKPCQWKGCPFPALNVVCRSHERFYSLPSYLWRGHLAKRDLWELPGEPEHRPFFSVVFANDADQLERSLRWER